MDGSRGATGAVDVGVSHLNMNINVIGGGHGLGSGSGGLASGGDRSTSGADSTSSSPPVGTQAHSHLHPERREEPIVYTEAVPNALQGYGVMVWLAMFRLISVFFFCAAKATALRGRDDILPSCIRENTHINNQDKCPIIFLFLISLC